jgi:hypothetical protein
VSSLPRARPAASSSRRRHARAGVPATAILFTDRKPLGPCLVEDISAGGLRVVAEAAVRRGRVVSVLLDLPGKGPLLTFAQVSRHERRGKGEHGLALAFINLPREEVERLQEVVARMLGDSQPCLEFFDTDDDGRAKLCVLDEGKPGG